MNTRVLVAAGGLAALVLSIGVGAALANNNDERKGIGQASAAAQMRDSAGRQIGTVRLAEENGELRVDAQLHELTAGFHGFHIHETGQCVGDSPSPFTSAGGHVAAPGSHHPGHVGDMPALLVGSGGSARATFTTDRVALADLLDADGSAVVVHAGPDNYANIPARYAPQGPDADTRATGDAGGRVACGVVVR